MLTFSLFSASGYLAAFLIAVTVALPYYMRRRGIPLRPHYLIGYAILVLAWTHSVAAMYAKTMSRTSLMGINAAMVALMLITVQVGIGQALAASRGARGKLTRFHFGVMLGIVVLVAVHLLLNNAVLHGRL
ncbi:MAG: hypothetical protein WA431_16575 [Candidatus Cybelea sp.]